MNKGKYGFVYLWYDKRNKMYYVGCRWGRIDDGYICSSNWMRMAFNRRPNDFKRRILKMNIPSRKELFEEEQRWLNMIKSTEIKPTNFNPRYYNLHITNNKLWHTYDENIKSIGQKISAAKKGKSTGPCSPEKAKAISEAKKASFKERLENTGSKFTENHKQKLSESHKGYKYSEEHKQEQSDRVKEQWASGERKARESISEEHKAAISKKLKGRKLEQYQIEAMRINNSKNYTITFNNGNIINVNGLKQYSKEYNIPYVTLFKAAQNNTAIKKYGISSIKSA